MTPEAEELVARLNQLDGIGVQPTGWGELFFHWRGSELQQSPWVPPGRRRGKGARSPGRAEHSAAEFLVRIVAPAGGSGVANDDAAIERDRFQPAGVPDPEQPAGAGPHSPVHPGLGAANAQTGEADMLNRKRPPHKAGEIHAAYNNVASKDFHVGLRQAQPLFEPVPNLFGKKGDRALFPKTAPDAA